MESVNTTYNLYKEYITNITEENQFIHNEAVKLMDFYF